MKVPLQFTIVSFITKAICTNKFLCYYVQHPNSLSRERKLDITINFLNLFEIMDWFFKENDSEEFISITKEYKLICSLSAYQNLKRVNITDREKRQSYKKSEKLL